MYSVVIVSRPCAKHFIYIILVSPIKQCHIADEETQAQRGSVACLKSVNLSFEFEPDSNIYSLELWSANCGS